METCQVFLYDTEEKRFPNRLKRILKRLGNRLSRKFQGRGVVFNYSTSLSH